MRQDCKTSSKVPTIKKKRKEKNPEEKKTYQACHQKSQMSRHHSQNNNSQMAGYHAVGVPMSSSVRHFRILLKCPYKVALRNPQMAYMCVYIPRYTYIHYTYTVALRRKHPEFSKVSKYIQISRMSAHSGSIIECP